MLINMRIIYGHTWFKRERHYTSNESKIFCLSTAELNDKNRDDLIKVYFNNELWCKKAFKNENMYRLNHQLRYAINKITRL